MLQKTLNSLFEKHREPQLFGRYIHNDSIEPLLKKLPLKFKIDIIGKSVLKKNIYSVTVGTGKTKVFMWSQMHGNESTTTKAIFDIFNTFCDSSTISEQILNECTIKVICILNPDGANVYTRLNANDVDLNRDATNLSQPESSALRACFDSFNPNFCFNLHGQRTIFSAGRFNKPATISFLAPAQDFECAITETRKKAMEIIGEMYASLRKEIPNQIGIYDDAFNINCVGDMFQSLNIPTILFEAGHFANDYEREEVRGLMFQALLVALQTISANSITGKKYEPYFDIPKNEKLFYDIIIKNTKLTVDNKLQVLDVGIVYQEKLIENKVQFLPKVESISDLNQFFSHHTIDAEQNEVLTDKKLPLFEGYENDFVFINDKKYSLKLT